LTTDVLLFIAAADTLTTRRWTSSMGRDDYTNACL